MTDCEKLAEKRRRHLAESCVPLVAHREVVVVHFIETLREVPIAPARVLDAAAKIIAFPSKQICLTNRWFKIRTGDVVRSTPLTAAQQGSKILIAQPFDVLRQQLLAPLLPQPFLFLVFLSRVAGVSTELVHGSGQVSGRCCAHGDFLSGRCRRIVPVAELFGRSTQSWPRGVTGSQRDRSQAWIPTCAGMTVGDWCSWERGGESECGSRVGDLAAGPAGGAGPRAFQYICRAPETFMVAPETKRACCEARKTTTGAISDGSAMRPRGVSLVIDSRTAGSRSVSSIEVAT